MGKEAFKCKTKKIYERVEKKIRKMEEEKLPSDKIDIILLF